MIGPGEVHVWRIRLDVAPEPDAAAVLSAAERERAARFHFDRDSRRFRVSHSALRRILGCYTGAAPESLEFGVGPHGKPFLYTAAGQGREPLPDGRGSVPDIAGAGGIRFNLSHSGELALCAVAADREVGVDVERLRAMPDFLAVADRFFTSEEAAALSGLNADQLQAAFFRTWTRKEAWLKATGEGIAGLGRPCPPGWTIRDLDLGPDYMGAVAFEGGGDVVLYE